MDKSDNHAVEIKEEHDQMEREFAEGFLLVRLTWKRFVPPEVNGGVKRISLPSCER